jgi:hypothetical protein
LGIVLPLHNAGNLLKMQEPERLDFIDINEFSRGLGIVMPRNPDI